MSRKFRVTLLFRKSGVSRKSGLLTENPQPYPTINRFVSVPEPARRTPHTLPDGPLRTPDVCDPFEVWSGWSTSHLPRLVVRSTLLFVLPTQ